MSHVPADINEQFLDAVAANNLAEMKKILEQSPDVDVDALDEDGNTALHFAADEDNFEMVKLLVDHGADVNAEDENEWTPLLCNVLTKMESRQPNDISVAEYLVVHAADVDTQNDDGETPLMLAAFSNNLALAKLLLDHDADVTISSDEDRNALHFAIKKEPGNQEHNPFSMVQLLVQHGADVNESDADGFTPLMNAAEAGNLALAEFLIESGAETTPKNFEEKTALDIAREHNFIKLTDFLSSNQ